VKALLIAVLVSGLLFPHSAVASPTDTGVDGGTSGVPVVAGDGPTTDTPLAEVAVVQMDGGWFITDEQMLAVGVKLVKGDNRARDAEKALKDCEDLSSPVGALKPFIYGVAAGATVVALAVIAGVVYAKVSSPP
jgi:hypothetical protein